ncbi:peptide ABC transporter ATP-binding protein, partial [Streptococcus suis]
DLTDPKTDVDPIRSNDGMVFQHFNLFPNKSVLDNITFAPIEHKLMEKSEAEKVGMELLEKVGLEDKRDAMPDSLSVGQ